MRTLLTTVATIAMAAAATIVTPAVSRADTCAEIEAGLPLPIEAPPCSDVLAQEARWLTAIASGDRATVEAILSQNFRHVNADGQMLDRAQEIAAMEPLPLTFQASLTLLRAAIRLLDLAVHGGHTAPRCVDQRLGLGGRHLPGRLAFLGKLPAPTLHDAAKLSGERRQ